MKTMAFKGSNVFMSRKLVPPEIFDALRDALKLNGAEVFLCSDPNRTSPDDFHVISAPDHEKFKDLRAKGCNLIGPQCVFSCAREHRAFPKQGYTCCLAMDNVKVLVSGFDTEEKSKIEKMVAAMGGTLISKTSTDVSFVVVKNVMAAKYKWALYTLKKPTVTIDWLDQCWNEHRIVPHESFRVLPFSGLTICTTGATVSREERMEMAKVILKNGGKYSSELNRKCTHLISDTPEGDKYKVARRWGHIYIVTRKWFDQSIARRACLDEESYPVRSGFASSSKGVKGSVKMQLSQGNDNSNLQSVQSSLAMETNSAVAPSTGLVDSDMEASISQNTSSTVPTRPVFGEEGDNIESVGQPQCETNLTNLDGCVADDSQSEDDDLYLSECRVLLTGFEAPEMRRLVNMVRRGGGSRHVQFNDKLTHIVIGSPSESEKKDIRSYAASGIVHVVRMTWLEDCDRLKKEVSVYQRHIAQDLLLPKGALPVMNCVNHDKLSVIQLSLPSDNQSSEAVSAGTGRTTSLEKYRAEQTEINMTRVKSVAAETKSPQQSKPTVVDGAHKGQGNDKKSSKISQQNSQNRKFSDVFKGKMFDFSSTFPEERKGEIVQWIKQGQGEVIDAFLKQSAHFTIECHGVTTKSSYASKSIYVSSHWVRSCLEDGRLLEVNSHILYSPLPCWIPFPGFEKIRFCVSQYEDKDRLLLRNLCFVLGAKLVQRLTKNVTYLLCKYAIGPKYEAACKWKISSVTSEWIYECVKKNKLVSLDLFAPKVVTAEDQEAGLCDMTQFTTQGAQMIPGERPSQFPSQFEDTRTMPSGNLGFGSICQVEAAAARENISKKARLLKDDGQKGLLSTSGTRFSAPTCSENSTGERISNNVPDVASAIEDLLEQTSKIHEQKSPGNTSIDETIFSSNPSTHGHDRLDTHSISGFSKHWPASGAKKDECSGVKNEGMHDGFSETQSESQVVGYEEDLSGRQMLIDKVRTRSSMI